MACHLAIGGRIRVWGLSWAAYRVLFYSDNAAVVAVIQHRSAIGIMFYYTTPLTVSVFLRGPLPV